MIKGYGSIEAGTSCEHSLREACRLETISVTIRVIRSVCCRVKGFSPSNVPWGSQLLLTSRGILLVPSHTLRLFSVPQFSHQALSYLTRSLTLHPYPLFAHGYLKLPFWYPCLYFVASLLFMNGKPNLPY